VCASDGRIGRWSLLQRSCDTITESSTDLLQHAENDMTHPEMAIHKERTLVNGEERLHQTHLRELPVRV
jgi:hypothetical protein